MGNPVGFCFFLFFPGRNGGRFFLFFLERKGSKRKSIAEKLFLFAFGGLTNVQHKTDGSQSSRPFFRFKLDVRENAFCSKCPPQPLRLLFLFFKKRNRSLKEIVP